MIRLTRRGPFPRKPARFHPLGWAAGRLAAHGHSLDILARFSHQRLARISHQLTVEARDRPAITSLRLLTVLNVLFKYASAR